MKPFTYCYLNNLPPVPAHFLDNINSVKNNSILVKFDNDRYKRTDKINTIYDNYQVHADFQSWLEENIVAGAINYGIAFNSGETYPVRHLPHLDQSRDYNLTYILDTGGPTVQTNFYQEDGHPPERARGVPVTSNYDTLKLIDSVTFESNKWVVLNTRIIHSVENLQWPRLAIQIGLDSISFARLPIENHN